MHQAVLNRVHLSFLVVLGAAVIQASVYAGDGDGEVSKGDDADQVLAVLGEACVGGRGGVGLGGLYCRGDHAQRELPAGVQ